MPQDPNRLSQFWQELKRRKVVQVITVYAASAFVILELVDIIGEPLKLPSWLLPVVIVLLSVGFVIAVIVSWIYDIRPDGVIVKTATSQKGEGELKPTASGSWKIASYISFVVIVALIVLNIIPRDRKKTVTVVLDKSIAVLPFRNDSPEQENEYFINGYMESILNNLCKIKELRVISRSSMEVYRDSTVRIPDVAGVLGVAYVLEGSMQKYGDHIRLTLQLIDRYDNHKWGEQYDREITRVEEHLSLQSEIAQLVAQELQALITPGEKELIEHVPTKNMAAYNLYFQGRHSFNTEAGREGFDQSIQFFKQALELDPDYALAYSGLAASYSAYAHSGILPRSEVMEQARDAAQKALSIDNTLGEAQAELAWVRIYQDFEWEEGEKGLRLALQLDPNYALGHQKYSWLLTFVGRFDEAIAEARLAVECDPLDTGYWVWLGRAYIYADKYDLAIEELKRALTNYPDNDHGYRWLAVAHLQKGMVKEAMDAFSKVSTKGTDWIDGYIYGMAGETEKAREVLDYHLEQSKVRFIKPTDFTVIYAALGEYDTALDYLEQAYEQREGWLVLLQVEVMYDSLRDNPRFQAVLQKMDYPP